MNRLELQSRALRGEVPLVPIGITHKEWTGKPNPESETEWRGNPSGYLPSQEVATLEVVSTADHPLVFVSFDLSTHVAPFYLVHFLQVGNSVLIDDPRGIAADTLKDKRLAPARLTKGEKVVLKVQNWDACLRCFYGALLFAKDET